VRVIHAQIPAGPALGRGLPAAVGAGRAPAGCHVQALTIDLGRERRPTKYQ